MTVLSSVAPMEPPVSKSAVAKSFLESVISFETPSSDMLKVRSALVSADCSAVKSIAVPVMDWLADMVLLPVSVVAEASCLTLKVALPTFAE